MSDKELPARFHLKAINIYYKFLQEAENLQPKTEYNGWVIEKIDEVRSNG